MTRLGARPWIIDQRKRGEKVVGRLPVPVGCDGDLASEIRAAYSASLDAVILNKTMSLVVVVTALIFRTRTVPFSDIGANWPIIVNLLAGSLIGAWMGATWAIRLKSETL